MRPEITISDEQRITLVNEFSQVLEAQNTVYPLTHKILDLSASTDEVQQWYFARDPYIDSDLLLLEALKHTEDPEPSQIIIKDMLREPSVIFAGGVLLAASRIIPEAFGSTDPEERKKSFRQHFAHCIALNEIQCPIEVTDTQALLLTCMASLNNIYEFNEADIEPLFIAAEMLENGTAGQIHLKPPSELEVQFNQFAQQLSRKLYHRVADFSTEHPGRRELSDGVRMLGLTASMQIASWNMGASMNKLAGEGLSKADADFAYLVTRMHNTIFGIGTDIDKRLKTREVKGPLHEAIWFLDTYVLRRLYPEKYGNIQMNPSYLRDDAPEVNYPGHNRGYDFVVTNGVAQDYVQLKSGHDTRGYHPAITVLQEGNFQDIQNQGKRLRIKLEAYLKWVTSDCDPSMAPTLERLALPTAKAEMEDMATLAETRRNIISQMLLQSVRIHAVDGPVQTAPVSRVHKIIRS